MPLAVASLSRKDFTSDQEVRWMPGCGDYAILSAVQSLLPGLGILRENTVVISGIGYLAIPLLHQQLRHALHPWSGADHRHGPGHDPSGPGDHDRHW